MSGEKRKLRIHVLHCGSMLVSEKVPSGGGVSLKNAMHGVFDGASKRVELPVSAYLIEHPQGLVLVDTGWSREISPEGVYDPAAVRKQLPAHLAAFYRPWVERGAAAVEQLAAMGIRPEDLHTVLLTHLDPDHTSGLRSLRNAKRLLLPEEERWWCLRTVYKMRQPKELWMDLPVEVFWFKGTMDGPLWWSYDLFGDGTVTLVCLPGHTDGMVGLKIKNGDKFVILTSDAAYSDASWRDRLLPGFGFNPVAMKKSLDWIAKEAADPNCVAVIANHDPAVRPQVIEL